MVRLTEGSILVPRGRRRRGCWLPRFGRFRGLTPAACWAVPRAVAQDEFRGLVTGGREL